ncbi:hypothetical protein [Deferrisoma sp.]
MRCGFCGREFSEEAARKECGACSLFGGCKNVKCPYCGYEMPREAGWVRWLRGRGKETKK